MNIIQLYQDFSINYYIEGHKHCRPGYVNIECPLCTGNPGYHLSYNIKNNYFICWRCGWHPIILIITKLLNITNREAYHIIQQYGGISKLIKEPKINLSKKKHKLPSSTTPLIKEHKKYLESRGFNSDKLEKEWKILSTSPSSILDKISYRFRILIPIIWNEKQVSFTTRDIIGKTNIKYKSCPKNREYIEHKHILYGKQDKWKSTGICVEGPTDVWRFGYHSFATFGIKYTFEQLRLIAKTFKRVPVCFDNDPQAIQQAKLLASELKFRGVDSFRVFIKEDPGNMKQEEADYLIKQLIK